MPDDLDAYLDPLPRTRAPRGNYDPLIEKHARENNVDPNLMRAVMGQESSGKPLAVSPKGARGLMQLMPKTAERFGVADMNDPDQNIGGGARYLKFLNKKFNGNVDLVLAGYNAGEGAVEKYGNKIPPYRETQQYVPAVKARYQKLTGQTPQTQQPQPQDLDAYLDPQQSQPASQPRPTPKPRSPFDVRIRSGVQGVEPSQKGISAARVSGEATPSESTQARGAFRGIARMAGLPTQVQTEAGDFINQGLGEATAGLMERGAGVLKSLPTGLPGGAGLRIAGNIKSPTTEKLQSGARTLRQASAAIDQDTPRAGVNVPLVGRVTTKDVQNLGSGVVETAPALVFQRLGVPAPVAFGLDSYLKAQGRDEDWKSVLKETGLGTATGGLYEIPLPAAAKSSLLRQIGSKLGLGAAGGYGLAKAFGMPESEARKNAAVMALFGAAGAKSKEAPKAEPLVPKALQERLRRADEANIQPAGVQPEGPREPTTGAGSGREVVASNAQPAAEGQTVRHVDLQPRRVRGEGKGQFKVETKAQREERVAQVSQPAAEPITPQSATKTPVAPAENPPMAATTSEASTAPPSEKGTPKLAQGVEAKAVAAKLTKGFEGLPEYQKVNVADQAQRATDLLKSDPERAKRIAMGQELPDGDLLPESVFTAVENHALSKGDVDTIRDLATASTLTKEATGMGQRIRMLAERNPYSPVTKIAEVQQAREARAERQFGKNGANKIKSEIQIELRKAAPKARDWQSFLSEISCK